MTKEYKIAAVISAVFLTVSVIVLFFTTDFIPNIQILSYLIVAIIVSSFFGQYVSKKVISIGEKIEKLINRILYYILFPPALIALLAWIAYKICMSSFDIISDVGCSILYSYGIIIGFIAALMALVLMVAVSVALFSGFPVLCASYVETIIVFILRKFMKNENTD